MTNEQRNQLNAMAAAARPIDDDEWGSERQIEAENAFHVFVSADLGVDTEDMATAKATAEEMIDEALRRAEMKHLCEEYKVWLDARPTFPRMSADELLHELYADDKISSTDAKWLSAFIDRWQQWEQWRTWSPRPSEEV